VLSPRGESGCFGVCTLAMVGSLLVFGPGKTGGELINVSAMLLRGSSTSSFLGSPASAAVVVSIPGDTTYSWVCRVGKRITGAMLFVVGDAVNGDVRGWIATRHTIAEGVFYSMLLVGSKQAKRFLFVAFTSFSFSLS
jgi:hypothetical protein